MTTYAVALTPRAVFGILQVPDPPLPPGVTDAGHEEAPASIVTVSVPGSTSWLPVVTVTVNNDADSLPYVTVVGDSETAAEVVSLFTVRLWAPELEAP